MKLMVKLTPIFVLVVLVFVFYTLFLFMNRSYEPMDNPPSCLDPVKEEDAPSCDGEGGTNSNVPGCYNTVRDHYNGFISDFMTSDYILKTQMVTPVCPNNPVGEVGSEYGKDERIVTPEDDKSPIKSYTAAKTDYDPKLVKPDETKKSTPFLDMSMFASSGTAAPQEESKPKTEPSNTYLLNASAPKAPEPPDASRGSCPPCPSCQRCPEPVVECKRVVNYNAAGVSNLPVPMIADFSKF
uniref:Uncharacterized protein n=1 Tax=viral metagenome TaxID=1070528 RepID=A0A6C0HMV4_9ZZZZ